MINECWVRKSDGYMWVDTSSWVQEGLTNLHCDKSVCERCESRGGWLRHYCATVDISERMVLRCCPYIAEHGVCQDAHGNQD